SSVWMSTDSLLTAAPRLQLCNGGARWNCPISMPTVGSLTVSWLTCQLPSVLILSPANQGTSYRLHALVVLVRPQVCRLGEEHQAEPALALGVTGQAAHRRDDVARPHTDPVFDFRTPVELELQPRA